MTIAFEPDRPPARGLWGTLGWTVAAILIGEAAGIVSALLMLGDPGIGLASDARFISLHVFVSAPVQVAVVAWAAGRWRPPALDYLGLHWPQRSAIGAALILLALLVIAINGSLYVLGYDFITPFQIATYNSAKQAGWLPQLWLAFVVFAPVSEEIVFRGFLYRGLARPGREPLAILLIALAWALLHLQYDWNGILQVFVLGLLLGLVRWSTGSTALTILMHTLINFEAMIETTIKIEFFS